MDAKQRKYLIVGGVTVAILFACCGGLGVVGVLLDQPTEKAATGKGGGDPERNPRGPDAPKGGPAGSSERLTQETYDRIRSGMTVDEVKTLLGPTPANQYRSKTDPKAVGMTWVSGPRSIAVTFHDGKVQGKTKVGF